MNSAECLPQVCFPLPIEGVHSVPFVGRHSLFYSKRLGHQPPLRRSRNQLLYPSWCAAFSLKMASGRFELPRPYGHRLLRPTRLPFRHEA
jgi:hypothetical protein